MSTAARVDAYVSGRQARGEVTQKSAGLQMDAAGIKSGPYDGVSGHALRHTCASDVYEASKDLRTVQEMLGHENLSTTALYLRHSNLDRMRAAMAGRNYAAPDPEPPPPAEGRKRGHLRVVA